MLWRSGAVSWGAKGLRHGLLLTGVVAATDDHSDSGRDDGGVWNRHVLVLGFDCAGMMGLGEVGS